ncbi:MAG TPA: haloalkane dehalogenase [Thermodesulfobacteriota bacterium]|nr:haloalkane dehalogenase [Thermodesulfobacteriota bacterium]
MTTKQEISAEFPYKPNYIEVHGSRMHYVDEGTGDPVLFLHGNPTSSYLWRNIIPYVTPLARCIAPDLIGMGKSDKPDIEYRFFDHLKYIDGFIEKMGLRNITLVVHDWGSALGFYYAMRHESNVKGLAFMEAIVLPVPSWEMFPQEVKEIFQGFRTPDVGWDMIVNKNMFIELILPGSIVRKLSVEEMNHYREPFKETSSLRPVWRWPNELPIEGEPADVVKTVETYNAWLQRTDLPKLLFYGNPGALIKAPVLEWCKQNLRHLKTVDIGPGIHYLQEDNPHFIGRELASWYKSLF